MRCAACCAVWCASDEGEAGLSEVWEVEREGEGSWRVQA
jgi:hypothetical protein